MPALSQFHSHSCRDASVEMPGQQCPGHSLLPSQLSTRQLWAQPCLSGRTAVDLAWGVRLMSNKGWKCPVTALRTETSPWAVWQSCPSCHCQNAPITFPFPDLLCIPLFIFDSLIQFIPVYHHIHLQKSARCLESKKCKNVTSKDREAIDASVSEVTCLFQKALC